LEFTSYATDQFIGEAFCVADDAANDGIHVIKGDHARNRDKKTDDRGYESG
jgi:hypothetical protein